ncbi:hypothetical protein T484DRAFT_1796622 [Baffinella frigidus]|nr:hypothetical protein T484DRAFT_1796622 [Cryptophyta sp. CCMP2293]
MVRPSLVCSRGSKEDSEANTHPAEPDVAKALRERGPTTPAPCLNAAARQAGAGTFGAASDTGAAFGPVAAPPPPTGAPNTSPVASISLRILPHPSSPSSPLVSLSLGVLLAPAVGAAGGDAPKRSAAGAPKAPSKAGAAAPPKDLVGVPPSAAPNPPHHLKAGAAALNAGGDALQAAGLEGGGEEDLDAEGAAGAPKSGTFGPGGASVVGGGRGHTMNQAAEGGAEGAPFGVNAGGFGSSSGQAETSGVLETFRAVGEQAAQAATPFGSFGSFGGGAFGAAVNLKP